MLIYSQTSQSGKRPLVDGFNTITNDAHDDLLPRTDAPYRAFVQLLHLFDILENANQRPRKQILLLVIHRHYNEQLNLSWLRKHPLPHREPLPIEFLRIARRRTVPQEPKLPQLLLLLLWCQLVKQPPWHWTIDRKIASGQRDLLDIGPARWLLVRRDGSRNRDGAVRCSGLQHGLPGVIVVCGIGTLCGMRLVRLVIVGDRFVGLVVVVEGV